MNQIGLAIMLAICVLLFVGLIIIIYVIVRKGNRSEQPIEIDSEFVSKLVECFGAKNIKNLGVDGSKLKVEVIELNKVNLEQLKTFASTGVFVTGNTIKTIFKYNSKALREEIDRYRRGNDGEDI